MAFNVLFQAIERNSGRSTPPYVLEQFTGMMGNSGEDGQPLKGDFGLLRTDTSVCIVQVSAMYQKTHNVAKLVYKKGRWGQIAKGKRDNGRRDSASLVKGLANEHFIPLTRENLEKYNLIRGNLMKEKCPHCVGTGYLGHNTKG